MKLSTKIFLPIILISALLISLTGCFGVPADDSPGYTPGSIKGTMARPEICCEDPQGELVGDPIDPNICDEVCKPQDTIDWYAWANVKVVLTTWVDSEEVELATTVTDENGDYLFNDVPPGKNYIITAICPTDEEFVVKDVAEEVVSGSSYDAGIADAESTVLALCLEGLGEIGLNSNILILNDFRSHGMYWQVVEEVCGYLADCDHAIPMWVCVITELCPGWTPGEGGNGDDPVTVTYTLTMAVNPAEGGTTNPSVGSHTYNDGTVVTLTATAVTCYDFIGWTGDVTSSDNPTSVTMNSNKTVTANFEPSLPPTANAGIDQSDEACPGDDSTITFAGSGSGTGTLVYDWDFGDGTTALDAGPTPSHTYLNPFTGSPYTVTLTVADACSSATDTMELTIHSSCGNLPDQLTISSSGIASSYYLWVTFIYSGSDILAHPNKYYGWCANLNEQGIPYDGDVMFAYCTLELDKYWDKINYIINNRDGYTRMAVQWAIWHYIHDIDPGSSYSWVNSKAWELINDADANGIGFCPGESQKYVVLLTFYEIDYYGGQYKCPPEHHEQNILIEVDWVDHCGDV